VVGYVPFSLWEIHKEGLCHSSGDINRLMMMMMIKKNIIGPALPLCTGFPRPTLFKKYGWYKID
jgi:hypothetical protein